MRLSDIVIHDGCLCRVAEQLLDGEPIYIPLCIQEQAEIAWALQQADDMRRYVEKISGESQE